MTATDLDWKSCQYFHLWFYKKKLYLPFHSECMKYGMNILSFTPVSQSKQLFRIVSKAYSSATYRGSHKYDLLIGRKYPQLCNFSGISNPRTLYITDLPSSATLIPVKETTPFRETHKPNVRNLCFFFQRRLRIEPLMTQSPAVVVPLPCSIVVVLLVMHGLGCAVGG